MPSWKGLARYPSSTWGSYVVLLSHLQWRAGIQAGLPTRLLLSAKLGGLGKIPFSNMGPICGLTKPVAMAHRRASTNTGSCLTMRCTSLRQILSGTQLPQAGLPLMMPPMPSWKGSARFPSPISGGPGPSWTSWRSSLQNRARYKPPSSQKMPVGRVQKP